MSRREQPAKPPPVLDFGAAAPREPMPVPQNSLLDVVPESTPDQILPVIRVPLRITRAQLAALADGETVVVPISIVQEGALRLADE